MNARPKRILVVATRQIGDVLLTTPLIRAAKQLWPHAAIDVLGFAGTLGMLEGNVDVRELIATPPRLGFAGGLALVRRLWKRYDLALIADIGDRAHIIGTVAARTRTGVIPKDNGSNWWKKALLSHAVVAAGDLGDVHVVQEKLALVAPWRDASAAPVAVVAPPAAALPSSLSTCIAPGYVVVHAPSMWTYKQWPPAHFRELIALLTASGRQVVLTGGPSQADRELVASLATDRAIDAGVLGFAQLTALLRDAALYIGPDTSVSHLAAATGVPMIAIFGPTNPMRWAPWPAAEAPVHFVRRAASQGVGPVTVLQDGERGCVPCGKAGCEDHRLSRADCLPAISPERIFAEAQAILSSRPRPGSWTTAPA